MLFSLKDLTSKLSPTSLDEIHTVKTNAFTLHHFESMTGMVFVLNTDANTSDLYQSLQSIYCNIYIDCISKNPLYKFNPNQKIECALFSKRLDEFIATLPCAK